MSTYVQNFPVVQGDTYMRFFACGRALSGLLTSAFVCRAI